MMQDFDMPDSEPTIIELRQYANRLVDSFDQLEFTPGTVALAAESALSVLLYSSEELEQEVIDVDRRTVEDDEDGELLIQRYIDMVSEADELNPDSLEETSARAERLLRYELASLLFSVSYEGRYPDNFQDQLRQHYAPEFTNGLLLVHRLIQEYA